MRRNRRLQEGGSDINTLILELLQSGETPENVVQTLVTNNVPEQEAVELVNQVINESGFMQKGGSLVDQSNTKEELVRAYQQGADRETLIDLLTQRGVSYADAVSIIDELISEVEGNSFQEGGEIPEEMQVLVNQVIEAFQEGYSAEEIIMNLIEQGIEEEVATQLVTEIQNRLS